MENEHPLLRLPQRVLSPVEHLIADDMERTLREAVDKRLQFMRLRGVTDAAALETERARFLEEQQPSRQQLLDKYLNTIPAYLTTTHCSYDVFAQAWVLMGTIWNTVLFERIRPIILLQQRYPVLLEVAARVGRTADPEGAEHASLATGGKIRYAHATPSDIEGITIGNDLSALLPIERAAMADSQLYGLFAYRFATRRLQTFQYKSETLKRSRKVEQQVRARMKGPMIVCLDTSGSMEGTPQNIAHSLTLRLLLTAVQQDRDLLLLLFASTVTTIDARAERSTLLDQLRTIKGGATDGNQMLQTAFSLITSSPRYHAADLLLLSDMKFDTPRPALQRTLAQLREEGMRLYALQIGRAPTEKTWAPLTDHLWHLDYKMPLRPWYIMK